MAVDCLATGVGRGATTTPLARLGQRITVTLSKRCRFSAIYCILTTQATTAATDIVAWDTTDTGCAVSADTSAYQNYIVGLPITAATAAWAISSYAWVQTSGNLIVTPDGTTLGNNLLGDGSVAVKETMMAHASTDGMVDTWATDAGLDIGVCLEADAPAITTYLLRCLASGYMN